jgi:hypothetical protein
MKYSFQRVLCTTIAVFLVTAAASLPAGAHHGADAVITIPVGAKETVETAAARSTNWLSTTA